MHKKGENIDKNSHSLLVIKDRERESEKERLVMIKRERERERGRERERLKGVEGTEGAIIGRRELRGGWEVEMWIIIRPSSSLLLNHDKTGGGCD